MESLIPVINQLQDICNTAAVSVPIDLPQIVVIGNQSSGKSSVIESIVKREFLPRGVGTVTRRPLEIRLVKVSDNDIKRVAEHNTNNNYNHYNNHNNNIDDHQQNKAQQLDYQDDDDSGISDYSQDWVKFGHLPNKVFTNFDEVRQEIENETNRVCGTNNGINSEPITLNIYSKNVVNLTLVDLPGLIYFPTGDQPTDIEDQVRGLIEKYISKPNCIILTVIAANHDFATSEAIKIAYNYDKKRRRTLAVLTKLDLVEPGVDILGILTGKLIHMKLGIIGVVNRSQAEGKSFEASIEDERKFLLEHFPSIADRNGQPFLSRRLSQLLMDHIKACLPKLGQDINALLSEYQDKLRSYGEEVRDQDKTILDSIQKISTKFCDTIVGGDYQDDDGTELKGGARIQYILHDTFGEALKAIDPLEKYNNKKILTIARNIAGTKRAISVPHTFDHIVAEQINRLEEPSLKCVEVVHRELVRFVKSSCDQIEILRFPRLKEKIEEILLTLLNDQVPTTKEAVKNSIKCYSAYIDTEHPTLREASHYQPRTPEEEASFNGDDPVGYDLELKECKLIAGKVVNYFNIIKQMVKLSVPGAIMHFMVNHVTNNVHTLLIKSLHQKELFEALLTESDEIAQKRKETLEMIETLKKAHEVLETIQDHE